MEVLNHRPLYIEVGVLNAPSKELKTSGFGLTSLSTSLAFGYFLFSTLCQFNVPTTEDEKNENENENENYCAFVHENENENENFWKNENENWIKISSTRSE